MHPRLKKIIFNKLYEDLKNAEIIPYKDSIWFIDREKKYWYLQYEKSGYLRWRYDFFTNFFRLFSLEQSEYERVIADWVEEVLNSRVNTTQLIKGVISIVVEEVLNFKVDTTFRSSSYVEIAVEEVLNSRVNTTNSHSWWLLTQVEDVLNSRVNTTIAQQSIIYRTVEEVLNFKVDTTKYLSWVTNNKVEEVLNSKVYTTSGRPAKLDGVEEVLNSTL